MFPTIVGKSAHADPNVQNIYHIGDDEFVPSGVPSVKIQFAVENGQATSVTIRGNGPNMTAKRVSA